MKVWVDPQRPPPPGTDWLWLRSVEAAITCLKGGPVETISCDYDFGRLACTKASPCLDALHGYACKWSCGCSCHHPEKNGADLVIYLANHGQWPESFHAHSQNGLGIQLMVTLLKKYSPYGKRLDRGYPWLLQYPVKKEKK